MSGAASSPLYAEEDLVPLSSLADVVFCERRAALHYLEGIWRDNIFTAEGTLLHEKADAGLSAEARGHVRIARGLRLRSLRLGLSGKADVVEFHRVDEGVPPGGKSIGTSLPGVSGIWRPFPVEYKHGRLRREEGYEVQLCAQAVSLEEMLNVEVPAGAVFYGQPRRRLEIAFTDGLRAQTEAAAARMHELARGAKTPLAQYEKKCDSCSLIALCLPKALGSRHGAREYLSQLFSEVQGEQGEVK